MASSSQKDTAFGGSCACGRISYTSSVPPFAFSACHCVTCRKLSGGPFQSFPTMPADKIAFQDSKANTNFQGLPKESTHGIKILRLSTFADRGFCSDCNTPLTMRYAHEPEVHSVTLGSVDEETIRDEEVRKALEPTSHIFCSQRAWWCKGIGKDGLKTTERFGNNFEENIEAWRKENERKCKSRL